MEAVLTVTFVGVKEGASKKNGKPWTQCTVYSSNDMMSHIFWNIKPDLMKKINQLSLERGDLIDLKINLNMTSGRPYIEVIDMERSELI